MFLSKIKLKNITTDSDKYPFSLPLVQNMQELSFGHPVTFFVGENGSGKSTILEALAVKTTLPTVGNSPSESDTTLKHAKALSKHMTLEWKKKTHTGFFLRAEDFFGFVKYINQLKQDLNTEKDHFENTLTGYGKQLATGAVTNQLNQLKENYGNDLDANSHGESFLTLFQSRIIPNGLYLLDEPETPLSPSRQLSLLSIIKEMVNNQNCQFIIVTHSPILMSYPGAQIYNFDITPPQTAEYSNLEHVSLTKKLLENPKAYFRHL